MVFGAYFTTEARSTQRTHGEKSKGYHEFKKSIWVGPTQVKAIIIRNKPRRKLSQGLLSICLLFLLSAPVLAHDGPPFPIIADKSVGPCVVSVWTDPDVGESTFFVIVNALPGGVIPSDLKVKIGIRPASARLAEVLYPAQREDQGGQVQYRTVAFLDKQEIWNVRVLL